ncbi:MAG TPA: Uma2 family endonuclease [Nitriliruptorales bacterium]
MPVEPVATGLSYEDLAALPDDGQRHGVREFWFVDLDAQRVEQYVLAEDGRYAPPAIVEEPDVVASIALDGLTVDLGDLFIHVG